jgi:hypothetical protein
VFPVGVGSDGGSHFHPTAPARDALWAFLAYAIQATLGE